MLASEPVQPAWKNRSSKPAQASAKMTYLKEKKAQTNSHRSSFQLYADHYRFRLSSGSR